MTTRRSGATRWSALLTAAVTAGAGLAVAVAPAASAAAEVPLTVGADDLGQQGNAAGAARSTAGPVSGPAATAVASGRDHGYLLDAAGRVWGWGDNGFGQVGDGTTTVRTAPVATALTGITEVEAGHYHGIALRSDGTVATWGFGTLGQLGLGTTTNRPTPTTVPGLAGVTHVVGGRDMSAAVLADGTVRTWGNNVNGELGDGTTVRRTTPVAVPGLTGVVELSGGRNHVLALTASGAVWAWGDNQYGQVGDGTLVDRRSPVLVAASGYVHVDAGAHHSIAVRADGTVATWGRGYRGQLGLGTTSNRTTPTTVPGLSGVVEVGDGRDQSFAVAADGRVWGWGANAAGQLGDGTSVQRATPALLPLTDVAAAQGGSAHTVFLPRTAAPPAAGVEHVAGAVSDASARVHRVVVPAPVAAGDGLVLVLTVNSLATVGAPTAGPGGAGWTPVRTVTGTDWTTTVWSRPAQAADAGSTVSVTLSATAKAALAVLAYRGTTPDVVTASAGARETVSRRAHTTPPVAVTVPGSLVLSVWADKSPLTTTITGPAGTLTRLTSTGTATGHITTTLADAVAAVPGTAGGLVGTADSATAKASMLSLVLAPAG